MHFSTVVLPLTLAVTAVCDPLAAPKPLPNDVQHAHQYRRVDTNLVRRLDIDPELVCGSGFADCGNGWCCGSGRTCDGEMENIPLCKAPDVTDGPLGKGSDVATPYKNVDSVIASLTKAIAGITDLPAIPGLNEITQGGGPTGTGQPANPQQSDAAVVSGPGAFGKTFGVVVGVWGAAALAGAGWFLM